MRVQDFESRYFWFQHMGCKCWSSAGKLKVKIHMFHHVTSHAYSSRPTHIPGRPWQQGRKKDSRKGERNVAIIIKKWWHATLQNPFLKLAGRLDATLYIFDGVKILSLVLWYGFFSAPLHGKTSRYATKLYRSFAQHRDVATSFFPALAQKPAAAKFSCTCTLMLRWKMRVSVCRTTDAR